MEWKCPSCGEINSNDMMRCPCGHDIQEGESLNYVIPKKTSNFHVNQKLKFSKQVSVEEIKCFLKGWLEQSCNYKVTSEDSSSIIIDGKVMENLFTSMVKFSATITVKTDGENARISVDGTSAANWVFWVFVIIGFFTGILMIVAICLYLMQKNKPATTFKAAINAVDVEYGVI